MENKRDQILIDLEGAARAAVKYNNMAHTCRSLYEELKSEKLAPGYRCKLSLSAYEDKIDVPTGIVEAIVFMMQVEYERLSAVAEMETVATAQLLKGADHV